MDKQVEFRSVNSLGRCFAEAIAITPRGGGGLEKIAGERHPDIDNFLRTLRRDPAYQYVLMTPMGAFVRVTLPLSAPALAITAIFSFIAGWSEFITARVILANPKLYTLPVGLAGLAGVFQTEWANYAAGSILVCIPVLVLFVLLNRFLVSGLTLGGIKG